MDDPHSPMMTLFYLLRAKGFQLGPDAWMDFSRALHSGFGLASNDRLYHCGRALWVTSSHELEVYNELFREVIQECEPVVASPHDDITPAPEMDPPSPAPQARPNDWAPVPSPGAFKAATTKTDYRGFVPPPITETSRANLTLSRAAIDRISSSIDLAAHTVGWPLDFRDLVSVVQNSFTRRVPSHWEIDVPRTVDRLARDRILLEPVWAQDKRRMRLLVLIDSGGSMTPYEPLTRILTAALHAAGTALGCRFAWFRNVPDSSLYLDPEESSPVDAWVCFDDAQRLRMGILVVGDAGAARRKNRLERRQATLRWIEHIRHRDIPMAWLNPCPRPRWRGTSATVLADCDMMSGELTCQGVREALRYLQGLSPHPQASLREPLRTEFTAEVSPKPQTLEPIDRWFSQQTPGHHTLAMHLAVPLTLTPLIAFAIWSRFQKDSAGKHLDIPWNAVPDVLLSPACCEIGDGKYQMGSETRRLLLARLVAEPELGRERMVAVALLLKQLVTDELKSPWQSQRTYAMSQQWMANSIVNPSGARRRFLNELRNYPIIESSRFAWLTNLALATQFSDDEPSLRMSAFVKGIRAERSGRHDEAERELRLATINGSDLQLDGMSLPNTTGSPTDQTQLKIVLIVQRSSLTEAIRRQLDKRGELRAEVNRAGAVAYRGPVGSVYMRLTILDTADRTRTINRAFLATEKPNLVVSLGALIRQSERSQGRPCIVQSFVRTNDPSTSQMTDVVVCFSGEDEKWWKRLELHVQDTAVHYRVVSVDTRTNSSPTPPGIFPQTQTILLLVSPRLISRGPMWQAIEAALRQAQATDRVKIVWLPVESCDWKRTALANYQPAADPSRPLDTLSEPEQRETLDRLAQLLSRYSNQNARERVHCSWRVLHQTRAFLKQFYLKRSLGEDLMRREVTLPNDEMKGRIIGPEGRNIRAFELATGVDVVVDDIPRIVRISTADPVKCQIAHQAMSKLVEDGRIHPQRINQVVAETKKEIEEILQQKLAGEYCIELSSLPSFNSGQSQPPTSTTFDEYPFASHQEYAQADHYLALRVAAKSPDDHFPLEELATIAEGLVEFLVEDLSWITNPNPDSPVFYLPPLEVDSHSDGRDDDTAAASLAPGQRLTFDEPDARRNGVKAMAYAHNSNIEAHSRMWLRWGNTDHRRFDIYAVLREAGLARQYEDDHVLWQSFLGWLSSLPPSLIVVDDIQEESNEVAGLLNAGTRHLLILTRREAVPRTSAATSTEPSGQPTPPDDLPPNDQQSAPTDSATPAKPKPSGSSRFINRYGQAILKNLRVHAVWLPTTPVSLGDVGFIQSGTFVRQTSLKDLGITTRSIRTSVPDISLQSEASIDVPPFDSAASPVGGNNLVIKFSKEGGVFFQANHCTLEEVDRVEQLADSLMNLHKDSRWQTEWVVVHQLYRVERAVIVIANSSKSRIEFTTSAGAMDPQLSNLDSTFKVAFESEIAFKLIAQSGIVPLVGLARLKRGWLGRTRFEIITPPQEPPPRERPTRRRPPREPPSEKSF